jgi:beta-mannosidase
MVWQDFMFACGMYPGDDAFMKNVREEVKYQLERLKDHPCIVLWCGNNEVEEAWKNWGWQGQFNLHGTDSAKVWNDYKRLFQDSLKKWVDEFDGSRPYVSTSPKNGWGHKESFTEGDSHYWGVWWGLEDWEAFENKTGRFVSEYGMQAMPNWNTIKSFTDSSDRNKQSPIIQAHQKASNGFKKLDHYLTRYFIDSAKLSRLSLEDYTYLSQCMQYYILKNSIATHRSKSPVNMGTLLWQLNDCWPVASWSITDYSRQPKAAWYAVKEAYRDDVLPVKDLVYPKDLTLQKPQFTIFTSGNSVSITSNVAVKYLYLSTKDNDLSLSDNYFDLKPGETKKINTNKIINLPDLKIKSLYDVLVK